MKTRFAMNCVFVTTLLLSHAVFSASRIEDTGSAQLEPAPATTLEAGVMTMHLQAKLDNDVQAETVERIKSDSRDELGRQLQNIRLFMQDGPAITSEFQITVNNPDRKIRLTSR